MKPSWSATKPLVGPDHLISCLTKMSYLTPLATGTSAHGCKVKSWTQSPNTPLPSNKRSSLRSRNRPEQPRTANNRLSASNDRATNACSVRKILHSSEQLSFSQHRIDKFKVCRFGQHPEILRNSISAASFSAILTNTVFFSFSSHAFSTNRESAEFLSSEHCNGSIIFASRKRLSQLLDSRHIRCLADDSEHIVRYGRLPK